jgi:hypothetical protein
MKTISLISKTFLPACIFTASFGRRIHHSTGREPVFAAAHELCQTKII